MYYNLSDYNCLPRYSGVYVIEYIEGSTGYYIGRANDFRNRFQSHMANLRKNCHDNDRIQNAYNKRGVEAFVIHIVYVGDNAVEVEQQGLDLYYGRPRCMNLSASAEGGRSGKTVYVYNKETLELELIANSKTEVVALNYIGSYSLGVDSDRYCSNTHIYSYMPLNNIELQELSSTFDSAKIKTEEARLNRASKPTYQYDTLTGKLINTFPSGYAAGRYVNNMGVANASFRQRICEGYLWSKDVILTPLEVLNRIQQIEENAIKTKLKVKKERANKVGQYDINTNELIQVYDSTRDAAKAVNGDHSYISKVCRGKKKSSKGFLWKYI